MSLNRAIAHNTAIQLVGKVVSTILGLVGITMLMRYLPTEQFGWYITTISFLQFIGILIDFGLIPVTAQMLSEQPDNQKTLLHNIIGFRITTATIFLLLAPLISFFFPYPTEVHVAIGLSTISFFCISLNQVMTGYFQTKLHMIIPVFGEIMSRITLIAGLSLGIFFSVQFLTIMAILVIASMAYTATMFIQLLKDGMFGISFQIDQWKKIIEKSWPITVAVIFNVVYLKSDTLILSVFRDQTEVALYGAAYRVIDIVAQTAMMIMGIMLPLLTGAYAKKLTNEFHNRLTQSISLMGLLSLPMIAGMFLLGGQIVRLIGGEKYGESGFILSILSLAVLGVFIGSIFGHVAVATNLQKKTLWIYAVSAIATLAGYLFYIPRFGMHGAAWMSVFSELCTGLLLAWYVMSIIKEPIEWKPLIKIMLSTIIMSTIVYIIRDTIHVALVIPIAMCVYGVSILALRVITKETLLDLLPIKKIQIPPSTL